MQGKSGSLIKQQNSALSAWNLIEYMYNSYYTRDSLYYFDMLTAIAASAPGIKLQLSAVVEEIPEYTYVIRQVWYRDANKLIVFLKLRDWNPHSPALN